jgi:NAD(P)-dependent dehydrogenase (short-subunit alcohol dehydrogenase family)
VIGRPDPEWGEVVVAYVVGEVDRNELDALCLNNIARFKRPKDYVFVSSLPKNNYGKSSRLSCAKSMVEVSEADWDRVFAVNLKSAYLTMKQVIPLMVGQGGGSIMNISSIASIRYTGVPYATYYASKAALNQLRERANDHI